MILSVVFIAIFGKSYIVYFSVPAIPTHCRRKVDTLLLPGNHAENIITILQSKFFRFLFSPSLPYFVHIVHVMTFSSRSYFNQGRPSHYFALKIRSDLFSFSYLNFFSAFVALSLVTCAGLFNPGRASFINFMGHNISLKVVRTELQIIFKSKG